jgi:hypothetical protein
MKKYKQWTVKYFVDELESSGYTPHDLNQRESVFKDVVASRKIKKSVKLFYNRLWRPIGL